MPIQPQHERYSGGYRPYVLEEFGWRPSDSHPGLRIIPGLTFYEAMDNCLAVRLWVYAACIMAGILLGLLV